MSTTHRGLQIYWASRIIAAVTATATPVVLTTSTLKSAVGSGVVAGMLSAQAIGQLLALLLAGVIIDRVNRKVFLIIVQSCAGLTWLSFSLLLILDTSVSTPWIALGAALGLLAGLNGPATQSLLSHLVDPEGMKSTLATIRISLNATALLAPLVAGAVIAFFPPYLVPGAMGVLMIVSAATLSALPTMRAQATAPTTMKLKELAEGWFISIIMVTSVMNLFWAGFFQLRGPLVIASTTESGPAQWGIVSASFAAGLIVGGFYYRKKVLKDPLGSPLLLLASKALPILVIALFPNVILLIITTFVAGFLLEAFAVNFYTQVQLRVPQHALGKALSLDGFIGIAFLPAGYWLAELSQKTNTTEIGGFLAAITTMVLAIVGWAMLKRYPPKSLESTRRY